MGKRKSAKKVQTRRGPEPLDKVFRCLFCQHPGTVTCKMDKGSRTGRLDCKNCGQNFQTPITHLSQPIDVYSEWIDEADKVNEKPEPQNAPRRRLNRADDEDDEDAQEEQPARRDTRYDSDDDLPDL